MIQTSPEIIQTIDAERGYALGKFGPRNRPVGEHILIIEKCFRDAKSAWVNYSGDNRSLHELRKTAAMILQCFSEHGVPSRSEHFHNGQGQDDLPQNGPIIRAACSHPDSLE